MLDMLAAGEVPVRDDEIDRGCLCSAGAYLGEVGLSFDAVPGWVRIVIILVCVALMLRKWLSLRGSRYATAHGNDR